MTDELHDRLASLDPDTSTAAAEELARRGDPADFDAVWSSVLRDCGMEYVLEAKVRAAARLADGAALRTLVATVEGADDALARVDAAEDDDDDFHDAGDLADEILRAQDAAVLALSALGEPALKPALELLERGGPLTRGRGAGRVLRALGDPRAAEPLERALAREDDHPAAAFLLDALDACAGEGATSTFVAWLRPEAGVNAGMAVAAAAAALVRRTGADALPHLLDAATDPAAEIRMGIPGALALLDDGEARDALQALADDDHHRVAAAARRARKRRDPA